jgi:tetratricopeptide (TPR) repeat protein
MHEARVRARARALPRAFLDEIARPDLDAKTTHAAIAGLIVLRMVDRWVAGGCRPVDVTGARKAVDEMEAGNPARGALGRVLTAIGGEGGLLNAAAAQALLDYGRALEFDAKLALALTVYDAVISHGGVGADERTVAMALLRKGICYRIEADLDQADAAYASSLGRAEDIRATDIVVRARLGLAYNAALRGHHDEADERICQLLASMPQGSNDLLRAMLLAGRAFVAGLRGDTEQVIRIGYEALCIAPPGEQRDGILHNLGESFRLLGYRESARDTFLVISCTSQRQEIRDGATIALMLLAAEDGERESFNEYRHRLASAELPLSIRVAFLSHLAVANEILGDTRAARCAREECQLLARQCGLVPQSSLIGEPNDTPPVRPEHRGGEPSESLEIIVQAIREMREVATSSP